MHGGGAAQVKGPTARAGQIPSLNAQTAREERDEEKRGRPDPERRERRQPCADAEDDEGYRPIRLSTVRVKVLVAGECVGVVLVGLVGDEGFGLEIVGFDRKRVTPRGPLRSVFESLQLVAKLRHGVELARQVRVGTRASEYVAVVRVEEQVVDAARAVGGAVDEGFERARGGDELADGGGPREHLAELGEPVHDDAKTVEEIGLDRHLPALGRVRRVHGEEHLLLAPEGVEVEAGVDVLVGHLRELQLVSSRFRKLRAKGERGLARGRRIPRALGRGLRRQLRLRLGLALGRGRGRDVGLGAHDFARVSKLGLGLGAHDLARVPKRLERVVVRARG